MNDKLEIENFSLRQRLESLLQEARINESKLRRFDQLERLLIGANSLVELLRLVLAEYQQAFGVEFVTLTLIDQDYEIARILEGASDSQLNGLSLLQSSDPLTAVYGTEYRPFLDRYDAHRYQPLFCNVPAAAVATVALLPLVRQGELIGSFNLGSADPERYVAGCGTDFLDRLASIVSICLEAALGRERLKRVGFIDALTGVQNRRYFEHRCQIEISQARRYKHSLACMFLDVDKFKRINDSYGHQAGDEILRGVAAAIQAQLRAGDTIARYGGEEFVALLPQTAGHHAHEIAERIRHAIADTQCMAPSGDAIGVTISIGLSVLPIDGLSGENSQHAEWLVSAADKALYRAKHSGRNRVVCDETMQMNEIHCVASPRAWLGNVLTRLGHLALDTAAFATGRLKRLMGA